jgi:hypothetical protein
MDRHLQCLASRPIGDRCDVGRETYGPRGGLIERDLRGTRRSVFTDDSCGLNCIQQLLRLPGESGGENTD